MYPVTEDIRLEENELEFSFIRASGPGGQNVNRVATAVQLRFDVRCSKSIPEAVKEKMKPVAGRRMDKNGIITITARRFRSQQQNRLDAISRLIKIIYTAAYPEKKRVFTKPTRASIEKRLDVKRRRGIVKAGRRLPNLDD